MKTTASEGWIKQPLRKEARRFEQKHSRVIRQRYAFFETTTP
jgi:hypothetical protein